MGPIKEPERAAEKAEKDYQNDLSRLIDIVRATIAFRNLKDIIEAVKSLTQISHVKGQRMDLTEH